MTVSVNRQTQASPGTVVGPVFKAWSELKTYLERRSKELSDEVRSYPTPIARCDEQLTKLIEQRAAAIDRLKSLLEAAPARSGRADHRQLAALEACLMRPQALTDDEAETALRLRLRTALSQLRGKA